jgi:hypothetical protein
MSLQKRVEIVSDSTDCNCLTNLLDHSSPLLLLNQNNLKANDKNVENIDLILMNEKNSSSYLDSNPPMNSHITTSNNKTSNNTTRNDNPNVFIANQQRKFQSPKLTPKIPPGFEKQFAHLLISDSNPSNNNSSEDEDEDDDKPYIPLIKSATRYIPPGERKRMLQNKDVTLTGQRHSPPQISSVPQHSNPRKKKTVYKFEHDTQLLLMKLADIGNVKYMPQKRAGVIMYSIEEDKIYFGFGVDARFNELTDFGGHYSPDEDHNIFHTTCREYNEETRETCPEIYQHILDRDNFVAYGDIMMIVFVPVGSLKRKEINERFHQSIKDGKFKDSKFHNEMSDIEWISGNDLQVLLTQNFNPTINYSEVKARPIFGRVKWFLNKATDEGKLIVDLLLKKHRQQLQ